MRTLAVTAGPRHIGSEHCSFIRSRHLPCTCAQPQPPRPRAPPLSLVRVYADINTCVCLTMCTHFHLPSLSCLAVARSLHSPAAYYRNWPVDIVIQAYFGMQQPLGAVGEVAFKKQLYQSMLGQSKIPLSNRQSARGH